MSGWWSRFVDWAALRVSTETATALNHVGQEARANHALTRRTPTEWEERQDASYSDTCRRVAMIEAAVEALRRERPP